MSHRFEVQDDGPGIGHNSGTLADKHKDLVTRAEELAAAAAKVPATIEDEATQAKVGDLAKLIMAVSSKAKSAHKAEKEPHLEAGRAVDAFFLAGIVKPMDELKIGLEKKSTAFLRRREAEERERLAAIARAAAEEAAKAAAAAATQEDVKTAVDLGVEARIAVQAAQAPVADLVRTRGAMGSVTTARKEWFAEIEDLAAIPLDRIRSFLSVTEVERAVKAYVKAGGRELPGVRIFEDIKAGFR